MDYCTTAGDHIWFLFGQLRTGILGNMITETGKLKTGGWGGGVASSLCVYYLQVSTSGYLTSLAKLKTLPRHCSSIHLPLAHEFSPANVNHFRVESERITRM